MCGIAGIYNLKDEVVHTDPMRKMIDAFAHRGPDDEGIYEENQLVLGHKRLSILDVSTAGHQPMHSTDGRYTIVFNGLIYNYKELHAQLSSYDFKSGTDTEVLLAAYSKWGVACLEKLNGMYAFAIWDKQKEEIFVARDRIGIKPLYYSIDDNHFIFSSEIRAIMRSGLVRNKVDPTGFLDYLENGTVHSTGTIIKGISILLPGNYMVLSQKQLQLKEYWSLTNNIDHSSEGKSYSEVCSNTRHLLLKSIERRLNSDVTLGAFLSGGIDSSAIVGLMSEVSTNQTKTFSIAFDENKFNEAKYARTIAKKFNTDHQEVLVKPSDFLNYLPEAIRSLDHPSNDGMNSYVVSKFTKEAGITVALSGTGGDELFAGYGGIFGRLQKLKNFEKAWQFPSSLRKLLGYGLELVHPTVASLKIKQILQQESGEFHVAYPTIRQVFVDSYLKKLVSGKEIESEDNYMHDFLKNLNSDFDSSNYLSQISVAETRFYLHGVLLRDIDQMSMKHALEVRVPFLDHEFVEYVLGINDAFKQPYTPKKLLVDSLDGLLPDEIANRPKMGFVFPWEFWLKNELRDFCEEHLNSLSNKLELFNGQAVLDLWNNFLRNDKRVNFRMIWTLVVLDNWLHENNVEI